VDVDTSQSSYEEDWRSVNQKHCSCKRRSLIGIWISSIKKLNECKHEVNLLIYIAESERDLVYHQNQI